MKKIIIISLILFASCQLRTSESWQPHNHKTPKSYKHK